MKILETKKNISKSLTQEQRKLIEDNIREIRKVLSSIFKNQNKVRQSLFHLIEAARKYNPKLNKRFVTYAYNLCYQRSIDDFRKENRRPTHGSVKDIRTMYLQKDFDIFEWEDTKQNAIKNIDPFFIEENENKRRIYKSIIVDYLIPIADGDDNVTMANIAKRYGVSIFTVSSMTQSDKIKEFINNFITYEKSR